MLRNLKAEMARAGLNSEDLARVTGKSGRAIRSKVSGSSSFTLPEALIIRATLFPELTLEYLFATDDEIE